jgi:glutathione-regulated potassium-efflux system ancillary protein KefG
MAKVLIIFAHPRLENSKINKALLKQLPKHVDIVFNDLYEYYPNFNIDINKEKELLANADYVVLQHPFYWYSCPPLLKQWIDIVLELGWAYGPGGSALKGKKIFNCITTGGAVEAYTAEGRNRYTIKELLAPFDQTAFLCQMQYLPPFTVMGTHRLLDDELSHSATLYRNMMLDIVNDKFMINEVLTFQSINQYMAKNE